VAVTAAPSTTSFTAQLTNTEIGSLDGRIVCHECRRFIRIPLDQWHSAIGYASSANGRTLWRLQGVFCSGCQPDTDDGRKDWRHGRANEALVSVVLRREPEHTPRVTKVVVLDDIIENTRAMQ
jgi:hypothetical protein